MISEFASDLVTKLNTLTEFGGRVGVTTGGTEADPTLSGLEAPAAWVVFRGMQNTDQPNRRFQVMRLFFSAVIKLDYGKGEADFHTQLQLIELASQAVRGTTVPRANDTPGRDEDLWAYEGCSIIDVAADTVVYDLTFAASTAYSRN